MPRPGSPSLLSPVTGCILPCLPVSPVTGYILSCLPVTASPPHAGLRRSCCSSACPADALKRQQGVARAAEVERGGGKQGIQLGEGEQHRWWSRLVEEVGQGEDSFSAKGGDCVTADHARR